MQTEVFMIEFWQKISGILMRHRHFTNYRAICIDTMGKKSLFFLMSMMPVYLKGQRTIQKRLGETFVVKVLTL